jgi:hypothetical protein
MALEFATSEKDESVRNANVNQPIKKVFFAVDLFFELIHEDTKVRARYQLFRFHVRVPVLYIKRRRLRRWVSFLVRASLFGKVSCFGGIASVGAHDTTRDSGRG